MDLRPCAARDRHVDCLPTIIADDGDDELLRCRGHPTKEMTERIAASGEKVEDYIDVKLSVSESRYSNWPTTLREQFAAARTVEEGKPSITLTLDGGAA